MKRFTYLILLAISAYLFTACPPAQESVNSDQEEAKTPEEIVSDLPEVLSELSDKAREAVKEKDGKYFEDFLSDRFVGVGMFGRDSKSDRVGYVTNFPCELKSVESSDPQVVDLGAGVALLTMKTNDDVECDGKAMLRPWWIAVVYVKDGDNWKGAYHQVLATADAQGEPPAKRDGATDTPPEDADKELTARLSEITKAGWEAWSKQDAEWFEDNTSDKYVAITGGEGRQDRAERIKYQGENKCDVESVSHEDQRSTRFSDDVALLTYKTALKATCDGASVPNIIWGSNIFVRDGDGWKLAFHMGTPGS